MTPQRILTNEQLADFQRDGFVVAPRLFSADEVSRLRALVEEEAMKARQVGRVLKPARGEIIPVGDLCTLGELEDLIFDQRILDCARQALATERLVYFGDSSIMVGGQLRGFHKDNADRYDATADDWSRPYELIRFGLYLDDHDKWSGGLKVRAGSHLIPDISAGRLVDVPSRAGDLVMWSLRITHSGAAKRLRAAPFVALHPRVEERLSAHLVRPGPERRLAAFLTFAKKGAHLERYIAKHLDTVNYKDNYLVLSWRHSRWGASQAARADAVALEFLKPCDDYGALAEASPSSPEGIVAGQLHGERPPPNRLTRMKTRLEQAVNLIRGSM